MDRREHLNISATDLYHKLSWLNGLKMKHSFADYTSSEVHCIEYIGRNKDANGTRLAEAFYMTSGAISKMSKKLIKKGAIESYQKPDNKKEIYFRLTEEGKAIFNIHEKLHSEFQERDKIVFAQVSDEQLDSVIDFVEKYRKHLDGEIQKLDGKGISIHTQEQI